MVKNKKKTQARAATAQRMNSGEISFKKKVIREYRKEALENLSSLYSDGESKPVIKHEVEEPKRVLMMTPPSSAIVFQLFQYLRPEFISLLTHQYDDIRKSIQDKCNIPSLLAHIDKQRTNINTILGTMSRLLILELLRLDTKGSKFDEIHSRLEELFFLREGDLPLKGCKANFTNTDEVELLIERIAKESLNQETDEFYTERSGTRRRGRTPHSEMDKKPNRVNAIKSDFILSCKSLPPVSYDESKNQFYIDYARSSAPQIASAKEKNNNLQYLVDFYPVFVKELDAKNACIPTPNNHGFYQNRIKQGLRKLNSGQWPMKGLMQSIYNAEAILGRDELIVPKSKQTYYCAYSGERLMEGEKVWHLRILVNHGRRYKKWVKDGVIPASPNTSSEFTRSIKAYFVKSQITAQCSIFYAPMDPEYRKQCLAARAVPVRAMPQKQLPPQYNLPHNRQISVNTLWYTLSQLRAVLAKHQLEQFVQFPFQPKIGKLPFLMLLDQYTPYIKSLPDKENPQQSLRTLLFISTIPWFHETSLDEPDVSQYVDMVYDILLDFIELMFPYTEVSRTEPFPIPHERRVLSLPLLGLPLPTQTQKEVLLQIKPRLGNTVVLGKMLELCDKRPLQGSIDLKRLEASLVRHPCLYLSFFYVIYQQQYDASQQHPPPLSEYFKLLARMGLVVETNFSS